MDIICRELFPPDGLIPVNKIDRELADHISSIREHLAAIEEKAPKKDLDLDQTIIELRETPKEDGTTRTWPEIGAIVGRNEKTVCSRYHKLRDSAPTGQPLINDLDQFILDLHKKGTTDMEISIAVSRKYGKPLKVTYIARRIREIKHILGEE